MASGTISGTSNSYVYLKISWSSTAGTGGSTVKASLIAQNGSGAYWYATANNGYSLTINGGDAFTGNTAKLSSTKGGSSTLLTASKWIAYTGNKSITISGYANFNNITNNSTGGKLGERSVSGTATLDKVGSIPSAVSCTAPTAGYVSEVGQTVTISWGKTSSYSGSAGYYVDVSVSGGAWTRHATITNINTTSTTYTTAAGQGGTYQFRVLPYNDVGTASSYGYSGVLTRNSLSAPTIGTLGTFNPYVNSTYNVPLSGGSQANGAGFKRCANIHVNGNYKYAGAHPSSNGNTSVNITVSGDKIVADLPSGAYSSSSVFTIVAWTENSNGTRSSYAVKSFTVNINTDGGATPTISASTISGGALGHASTCFIAGVSELKVTVGSIALRRGATSYNWKIDVTGYSSATTSPKTYSNLTEGVKNITVTVTDNRGLSASTTSQIRVQAYAPPTIRNIKGARLANPNTSATVSYEPYHTPIYAYSAGIHTAGTQLNGINSQQRSVDGGSWANYSSGTAVTGLSVGSTHTIKIRIADKVKTSSYTESEVLIPTIVVPLAFRKTGIGINCIPASGYALDIGGAVRIFGSDRNVIIDSGSVQTKGTGGNGVKVGAGYIELSDATPYIDFHYGNSTDDYNVRLINNTSGQLTLVGSLNVQGRVIQMAYNIAANSNINDFTTTGIYICHEGSSYTNAPLTYLNGLMEVTNFGNNLIKQVYTRYDGAMWERVAWYGNWYAWKQIVS